MLQPYSQALDKAGKAFSLLSPFVRDEENKVLSMLLQENSTWSNLMLSIQADELTNKDWDRSSFHRQRREYHVHSHLFQNLVPTP